MYLNLVLKATQYKIKNINNIFFFKRNYNYYRMVKKILNKIIFYKTFNRGQIRKNFNLSKSYLLSKNF